MGIKERKKRQQLELKEKILDTAYQLFIEEGYDMVSMRKIAQVIEYSPGTIYLHYRDKTELFYELQQKLFREFSLMLLQELAPVKDPFARFRKMADLTVQFAIEKPETYHIMYLQKEPKRSKGGPSIWEIGAQSREFLKSLINECKEAGYFKNRDTDIVGYCSWACVHGIATTIATNRMKKDEEDSEENRMLKDKMLKGALPLFDEMLRSL